MKTGEAYISSPDKRALELGVITAMAVPLGGAAVVGTDIAVAHERTGHVFHEVDRALYPGDLFSVRKLGNPFDNSPAMLTLRKAMVDEIPQVADVIAGKMSLVGPRADKPDHVEQLFDALDSQDLAEQWQYVRSHQKPGILSSYAAYSHSRNLGGRSEAARLKTYVAKTENARRRAKDDIADFENASLHCDLQLLLATAAMAKTNYKTYIKRGISKLNTRVNRERA